ncbi:MAG: hypothetical protein IID31_11195 [Planctomycetes bacterium]|nr:hypothetical protein [Planctomycetota bacterium]
MTEAPKPITPKPEIAAAALFAFVLVVMAAWQLVKIAGIAGRCVCGCSGDCGGSE